MTAIIPTDTASISARTFGRRALGTIMVVLLAHVGVLLALATMQPMKLVLPEPPKPVEVRFIQLTPPKPPEPKPEPPKPLPKPKEVKVVKEQPKPKPLPKPKPVVATTTVSARPQAVVAPQPEPEPPKPIEPPAPPPQPAPTPKAEPKPEPAPPVTPQLVEGVSYIRQPRLEISDSELKGESRVVRLRISISTIGKVEDVQVVSSSGLTSLDQKVVRAIKKATFTPHRVNGVPVPVYTIQPFELNPSGN